MIKLIIVGLLALSCCSVLNAVPSGFRLREGDIMESLDRSVSVQNREWTNGVVYYVISSGYSTSQRNLIIDSMNTITNKTSGCITFVQRTSQSNYIDIKSVSGCYSYLGMIGGAQTVSLTSGCFSRGVIVHELMHALGYNHEQNRNDRDQYVTINLANVDSDKTNNFQKQTNGDYQNTPYDYASIMHYGEYSFSNNGQKTIIPKNGNTIKEPYNKNNYWEVMTNLDVYAVRRRYQCTGATNPPITPPACFNELDSCDRYAAQKDLYCNGGTFGDRPFNEACRLLCDNCAGQVTPTPATIPPATTTTTTTTQAPNPGTCTNDSPYCNYYASYASQYCSSYVTLNNVRFNIACRALCNNCGTGATCANLPACSQITLYNVYCRTSNPYTFEGMYFRQACPVFCNSCGE